MTYSVVFPGSYIQGAGALAALGKEASKFSDRLLLVGGGPAAAPLLAKHEQEWKQSCKLHYIEFNSECCDREIDKIILEAENSRAGIIAGMGGGKLIDTVKSVAGKKKLPLIIAPTIASTDAPCSSEAVIYTEDGKYLRSDRYRNPDIVIADTEVIGKAPARFLAAGMGDALSTYFEARSCAKTKALNQCGGHITIAAYALAEACHKTLMKSGRKALQDCKNQVLSKELDEIIEANILLSGAGFEGCGLAAAHAIHNGLTKLPQCAKALHGEKVAFGVLCSLMLNESPKPELDEIFSFCLACGLPVSLNEIGLDASDLRSLRIASEAACAPEETIHKEPVKVNADILLSAILQADEYGKALEKS